MCRQHCSFSNLNYEIEAKQIVEQHEQEFHGKSETVEQDHGEQMGEQAQQRNDFHSAEKRVKSSAISKLVSMQAAIIIRRNRTTFAFYYPDLPDWKKPPTECRSFVFPFP